MFWFSKKKTTGTKFLDNATDIHCHLLPGVDDGMEVLSDSFELLAQEEMAGLKRVYFTPHSMGLEGAVVDRESSRHHHHHHHHSEDSEAEIPEAEEAEGGVVSSAVLVKRHERLYRASAAASPF